MLLCNEVGVVIVIPSVMRVFGGSMCVSSCKCWCLLCTQLRCAVHYSVFSVVCV